MINNRITIETVLLQQNKTNKKGIILFKMRENVKSRVICYNVKNTLI